MDLATLIIICYGISWLLYLAAIISLSSIKLANFFFILGFLLLSVEITLLAYNEGIWRLVTSHWSEVLAFLVAGSFLLLPLAFISNYGLVLPVFIVLVLLIGRFVASGAIDSDFARFDADNDVYLLFHIVLMLVGYLAFSLSFISSMLYLRLDKNIKQGKLVNPLAGGWNTEKINRTSYIFQVIGFGLFSISLFIAISEPFISGIAHDQRLPRIVPPILFWGVCAWNIVSCQRYGIRGGSLAIKSSVIFGLAIFLLIVEFSYL